MKSCWLDVLGNGSTCLSLPEEEVTVQAGPPVPAGEQAALLHAVVGCRASALAAALAPSEQTDLQRKLKKLM